MTDLIRRAVRDGGFVLHCQPIFDYGTQPGSADTSCCCGSRSPTARLIPPDRFLPVAEQIGAIRAIDRWVFSQAVDLLRHHAYGGRPAGQRQRDLADRPAVRHRPGPGGPGLGIDAARLTIEVTETAAIAHMEGALDLARQLRSVGCRLALDDFGAGFASFYYLKRLPFDVLKIDGEFVRDAVEDATSRAIIASVIQTAATIGSSTVAEYVENAATFKLMQELGVGAAQGYFIGRPRPARGARRQRADGVTQPAQPRLSASRRAAACRCATRLTTASVPLWA